MSKQESTNDRQAKHWRTSEEKYWRDQTLRIEGELDHCKTVLKKVAKYCNTVVEGRAHGEYGCGLGSTAEAILDILDENNIAMEQLK